MELSLSAVGSKIWASIFGDLFFLSSCFGDQCFHVALRMWQCYGQTWHLRTIQSAAIIGNCVALAGKLFPIVVVILQSSISSFPTVSVAVSLEQPLRSKFQWHGCLVPRKDCRNQTHVEDAEMALCLSQVTTVRSACRFRELQTFQAMSFKMRIRVSPSHALQVGCAI